MRPKEGCAPYQSSRNIGTKWWGSFPQSYLLYEGRAHCPEDIGILIDELNALIWPLTVRLCQ